MISKISGMAFAAVLLISTSWQAGAVRVVDPTAKNENRVVLEQSIDSGKPDARLDKKISYEARGKTVLAILNDLSAQTGVTLRAGYTTQDWQVRDRKMNLFIKDQTLKDVMKSVARVMHFRWSKNSRVEPPTYRLYMDRNMLIRTTQLLDKVQRTRDGLLDSFGDLGKLSPEELDKLKHESPYLYALASTGTAGALDEVFRVMPEVREALSSEGDITINSNALPQAAKDTLLELARSSIRLQLLRKSKPFLNADELTNDAYVQLSINNQRSPSQADFGHIEVSIAQGESGELLSNVAMVDPNNESINTFYGSMIDPKNKDLSLRDIVKNFNEASAKADKGTESQTEDDKLTYEPRIQHEDDPELAKKVKLEIKKVRKDGRALPADYLAAFAKASEFSIVSDAFYEYYDNYRLANGEIELRTFVDGYAGSHGCNWWRKDAIIEFRDRCWFKKRCLQIPESVLEGWRHSAVATGDLSLDEVAEVGALSERQVIFNTRDDDILERMQLEGVVQAVGTNWVRLCRDFSPQQRRQLLTRTGIPWESLSERQLGMVRGYMLSWQNEEVLEDGFFTRLFAVRTDGGYTLKARSKNGDDFPGMANIWFKKYTPDKATAKEIREAIQQ